jgi:hypothetical protein
MIGHFERRPLALRLYNVHQGLWPGVTLVAAAPGAKFAIENAVDVWSKKTLTHFQIWAFA